MERAARIRDVVYEALEDINLQLPAAQRFALDDETVLCAAGAGLDSLGLVNLIVGVEERLRRTLGCEVNLADESLLGQADSPFRTVATLVAFIASLV